MIASIKKSVAHLSDGQVTGKHGSKNTVIGTKDTSTPAFDDFKQDDSGMTMTTNQGMPVSEDANSLKAGARGPTLLEDFRFQEKMTHFDHERIPERVVHARGAGAHGYFQVYDNSLSQYTRAKFLTDPSLKTPTFTRFSTAVGFRGSADTVRDVRGFATKFYTPEGNYDMVNNNIPVFFIQDAIKFPDVVHALKPEPDNEIPQAQSAHNTVYDFLANQPEMAHMMMWTNSDRGIPRAYANMEGFGVHTYRLVNAEGHSTFVKFHWKPVAGLASLVWDEAQKIAGKDPDFHRRQMWEMIENGDFLEFELGMQLFGDDQANSFNFDILDATKLIPEELLPVKIVGRLVLNRNQENFFCETEQVAFCVSNVVPGIDFTNDPLLQGRIFSYLDTQLLRLGGPNFHEIPINRPICPFANNQRDGFHRQTINIGKTAYDVNSIGDGWPKVKPANAGSFATYPERIDGQKLRIRSPSFSDHFSQATMFWNSQTAIEKDHLVASWSFELAKCTMVEIRQRVLQNILANIDKELCDRVAANLGLPSPATDVKKDTHGAGPASSPLLSMLHPRNMNHLKMKLSGRKIAILAAEGVKTSDIQAIKTAIEGAGGMTKVVSSKLGTLHGVEIDATVLTLPSVVFDAVAIPGGQNSVDFLSKNGDAVHFVAEAYKHCKPIAACNEGQNLLVKAGLHVNSDGVFVGGASDILTKFVEAIGLHRVWSRTDTDAISA